MMMTTIGDGAFPLATSRSWNSLPPRVRAASSIVCSFLRELKTFQFAQESFLLCNSHYETAY